jgi:hypothetical protein
VYQNQGRFPSDLLRPKCLESLAFSEKLWLNGRIMTQPGQYLEQIQTEISELRAKGRPVLAVFYLD